MKQNETIDILMPNYNGEKFIQKCLNSILSQTYKNLRIVIVDDGSTDNSLKIIQNIAKQHSNIEVFTKQNENNISKTRNFLLTKIKSKYFTFFDNDDYAEPEYIETLYNLMKTYNADVSLCSKSRHKDTKNVNLSKFNKKCDTVLFMNQQECIAEMLSSNLFNGTVYCKLMKSSLVQNSKFDPNIHYGEDLDFCYQIMKNAQSFVYTSKKLYHYIIRDGSIVTSKFKETKLTCLDCYDKIISQEKSNPELYISAVSMQGLIAIELLYYTWRDKVKNKPLKKRLKSIIKNSIPYVKKNKRFSKLLKCTPLVWRLTKIM